MLLLMQQAERLEATPYITLVAATDLLRLSLAEVEALAESGHLDTFVDDDGAVYVSHFSVIRHAVETFHAQLRDEGVR